jgi:hypothetical protein
VALAAPASADVTGTTSTGDVVLYDHCQRHPISYDVRVGPGTSMWRLEIQVFDPDGMSSEGTVINSTTNPPTSGTVHVTFCGSEKAGNYTVRATGFYEIVPAVQLPFALPETTFQVRPAATRTALAEKALGAHRYQLTTRVQTEAEHGFDRSNGVTVRLERLVDGRWEKVRGTTLTTVHGAARAILRGRPGTRVRAVVPPENSYAGSVSRPVTL